jgi:hypothetical protein
MTSTPSPAQIADLLAWARCLTEASRSSDPADRAAYLAAKADPLARTTDQHSTTTRARTPDDRQIAELLRVHPHAVRP